jgi:PDZ domain-containing secreted protein
MLWQTLQNTTTVEIHNTTQEGESTSDDIEKLQSVQKATSSKTNSTKHSKASAKKVTMKHGQKTMETSYLGSYSFCVLVCDMLCTQSFGQSYRKCPGDRHL